MLLGILTIFSILSSALVILLLTLLTKNFFTDTAKRLQAQPGRSLLYGLLSIVLIPTASVLLFATVIGIPLGLLLLAIYGFSLFFLTAMSAVVLAKLLQMFYRRKWSRGKLFFVSVGVFIVLRLLVLVPILGWLFKTVVLLGCLGALLMTKWEKMRKII